MMPSAMPAGPGGGLHRGELLVEQPLQPAVELHLGGVPLPERGVRRTPRVRSSSGQSAGTPYSSTSAHQVAYVVRPSPSRSQKSTNDSSRRPVRPTSKT